MKKYIYKITNLINNKVYIGQTTDYKRRFSEHRSLGYGRQNSKYLYNAMRHYGIDNFSFEVIEYCENYNEREKFWIKEYNSYYKAENGWGYNMTEGGEEPPLNIGEKSPFVTHTLEEVNSVIDLISNTNISFCEIAKLTNYDVSSIKRINVGQLWHDDLLEYPLRIDHNPDFIQNRALKIIDDLQNTNLTQKEIAEKYGVGRSTVTAINRGQNNKQDHLDYPIRKTDRHSKSILMYDLKGNLLKEFDSIKAAGDYLGGDNKRKYLSRMLNAGQSVIYNYKWKIKE